jgi:hypothetical protein
MVSRLHNHARPVNGQGGDLAGGLQVGGRDVYAIKERLGRVSIGGKTKRGRTGRHAASIYMCNRVIR